MDGSDYYSYGSDYYSYGSDYYSSREFYDKFRGHEFLVM
jgi:hypothetical protein